VFKLFNNHVIMLGLSDDMSAWIINACVLLVLDRVQEIANDDNGETGRIPRNIDCELTLDLGLFYL